MKIINILIQTTGHYIVWFSCVLFAAHNFPWTGPLIAIFVTAGQYFWQHQNRDHKKLLHFMIALTLLGFISDTVYMHFGIIIFNSNPWQSVCSAPWIIAIWLNFSIVLYSCLKILFNKPVVLGLLSLIGFPLAYTAGVALGAASLPHGYQSSIIFGVTWGVLLPLITFYYHKNFIKEDDV